MRFRQLLILAMVAGLVLASGTYAKRGHGGHGPSDHGHGGGFGKRHGGGGGGSKGGAASCEAARCEIAAGLDAACPCDGFANHGGYVRCVAHTLKGLAADGLVPRRCKGHLVRCAARSTCGKTGPVPCLAPVSVCDLTLGTCAADATRPCAVDLDCGATCQVAATPEECAAAGGAPGAVITCCAACGSPSGAFLD